MPIAFISGSIQTSSFMFWRISIAFILVFWAVMTGLMIRDTYYPNDTRFVEVPVRLVFDLFLAEAVALNHTLDVYHETLKIGHAAFTIQPGSDDENVSSYAILVNGSVQIPTETATVNANFNLVAKLADAERWQSFKLKFKAPSAQTEAVISWKQGDVLPEVEVKKSGKVVMNTEMAQAVIDMKASLGGGSDWPWQLLPSGALPDQKAFKPKAREGQMLLAGKRRRCYIVQLPVIPGNEVIFYFTEIGELARVELPQEYRLIEPMMHGLELGLKNLE